MKFVYDDGGRAKAGYQGSAGDCVVRSIAIATGLPYQKVYDDLNELCKPHNDKRKKKGKKGMSSAREGVARPIYEKYLLNLGWKWQPTMFIGQGCKVHLKEDELPKGRLIVNVSKHMLCVIDGVIHDTYKEDRDGTRCVYGYFYLPEEKKVEEVTPDMLKKVEDLKAIRSNQKYYSRKMKQLEEDARKILKDDLTENIFEEVEKALQSLEKKAEDFVERTAKEKKEKEAAAKAKTLENAVRKVQEAGFDVALRPKVWFGTTEDSTYRFICMGPELKNGTRFTVYWSGGATWSDNGGQHYGESSVHFAYTYMENGVLKEQRVSGLMYGEVKDFMYGGRMSVERLKKLEPFIKKHIPNYVPLLVPATHLVVYNKEKK